MQIGLDIGVVLIFALSVYKGYRDGFVKTILNLLVAVVAMVLAYMFSRFVADFIYVNVVNPYILSGVHAGTETISGGNLLGGIKQFQSMLPEMIGNLVAFSEQNMGETFKILTGNFSGTQAELVQTLSDAIVKPIILNILRVIFFLIAFAIFMPILKGVVKRLSIINHIPLIGGINQLFGGIFGAGMGVICLIIIAFIIRMVLTLSGGEFQYLNQNHIDHTYLFKIIYNFPLLHS